MLRELAASPAQPALTYDVCVIGSGPAGAVVAAELVGSGLRVCVLESGRERPSPGADRLRRVECTGIRVKPWSRERVLGGASTTWAGLSAPLDDVDLAPRPWIASPGWPIARAELEALWEAAAQRYQFAPLAHYAPGGFAALRTRGELTPRWSLIEEKVFLARAEPQNFARLVRPLYEREDLDVWLDATVVELVPAVSGRAVGRALARSLGGVERSVEARAFVLACGGIENARLLLVSRGPRDKGLGNEFDQVGRYLMNHPKSYHGILHLARPVRSLPYYFGCLYQGFAGYGGLRLQETAQRERGLVNCYARLEPLYPWSDSEGVESLVALAKRSGRLFRRWKERRAERVVELRDWSETGDDSELQNARRSTAGWLGLGWNVLRDAPRVAAYSRSRLFDRRGPLVRRARLRNFMEMEPRPENRVTLSSEKDEFGYPRAKVEHDSSPGDRRSLIELHRALAQEFQAAGVGRLESELGLADPWPVDQDASHHMGTTRMGTDPTRSVVDPDLRLHEVENVYVAGASVFPTSGCANPTFTIAALSIRLARTLRTKLGAPRAATAART
jgi:choline dehydrogenase-like flavoprotein